MKRPKINSALLTHIILITILGLAVYANSLGGKFIWDDENLVKNNLFIREWSRAGLVFMRNISPNVTGLNYSFYRPLQMLSYAADHALWGVNSFGYHLTNVILHILVAISIYCLVNLLFGDRRASF